MKKPGTRNEKNTKEKQLKKDKMKKALLDSMSYHIITEGIGSMYAYTEYIKIKHPEQKGYNSKDFKTFYEGVLLGQKKTLELLKKRKWLYIPKIANNKTDKIAPRIVKDINEQFLRIVKK